MRVDLTPMQQQQLGLIQKTGEDLVDWLAGRRQPMTVELVGVSLAVLSLVENIDALKADGFTSDQLLRTRRLMRSYLRGAVAKLDLALGATVEVPDIKLLIADYLELRDESIGAVSDDEERATSATELHDAIQSIHAKLAVPE